VKGSGASCAKGCLLDKCLGPEETRTPLRLQAAMSQIERVEAEFLGVAEAPYDPIPLRVTKGPSPHVA
jgi:hypothetical protein